MDESSLTMCLIFKLFWSCW